MKKLILAASLICLSACGTEFPTRQLQEVKIVGHIPYKDEGQGMGRIVTYEQWIYENASTKERFTLKEKYGEVGEIIKMRR
jgi:hypothetical protein